VNVFAGGQIHDRVRAPLDGPAHFLDFLLDARGDGGVADVGVDFDQEIAPDDHRLQFGMIDVARNDGPPARHFVAHKFRRDLRRNGRAETIGPDAAAKVPRRAAARCRPMFSRMAMNSISGVMTPCRAY
jgi:hypothetical protein